MENVVSGAFPVSGHLVVLLLYVIHTLSMNCNSLYTEMENVNGVLRRSVAECHERMLQVV